MPIAGIVVTMKSSHVAHVLANLSADPRIQLGSRSGARVAAVIDSADVREQQEHLFTLRNAEGVLDVDVAYVDFEDTPRYERSPRRRSQAGAGGSR